LEIEGGICEIGDVPTYARGVEAYERFAPPLRKKSFAYAAMDTENRRQEGIGETICGGEKFGDHGRDSAVRHRRRPVDHELRVDVVVEQPY
jgi:hypothetical protein